MSGATKDLIADTIAEMAQQTGADKLTVKTVIEKSGISRQTFYYYFQDIIDAVEYAVRRKVRDLANSSADPGDLRSALRQLGASVAQDRTMFRRLMQSPRRERAEQMLVQGVREYLLAVMRTTDSQAVLKYAEAETALCFYTFAVVGVLLDCSQRPAIDVDQLTDRLYALLKGQSVLF